MGRMKSMFFPEKLWTGRFTFWWIISLATVFLFDIFWMLQTTFRPMSFFAFYPVLFLQAFILALPSLFFRRGVVQLLWLLFFDALFIANLMYCRTYYNAIPLQSYNLIGNLSDYQDSVTESFKWYFIFLPILTLAAEGIYLARIKTMDAKTPNLFLYLGYVFGLFVITWISDAGRGGTMERMNFMYDYAYLSSSITPIYSLGGFLWHDYHKSTEKLTPEEMEEVRDWLSEHDSYSENYWTDSLRKERKVPKNLVIILCESLESWVLEKEVEGKEITPNLNKLLRDSTTFFAPNVLTQVGSGRSIEGQLLIMAGLMPMHNKVYAYESVDNKFFTLPKAMKEKGAHTVIFTADKPYVWNQARLAPAFGFDKLYDDEDFIIDETTGTTKRLSDRSLMRQIVGKLKSGDDWNEGEPAMVLIVTNSGHNPFNLPDKLRDIEFSGNLPKIISDYMVTAHFTDKAISYMIGYLKERSDWEDTLVVITGDHEGLALDRKTALANAEASKFVDSGQHTPFIVLNSPIPGRYEKELGQVDMYSSILDLMNLNDYEWKGLGFSIFDENLSEIDADFKNKTGEISDFILRFNLLENYPYANETE